MTELILTVGIWLSTPLMAIASLTCLLFGRKEPHRKLVCAWGIFMVAALLLIGGGWLLGQLGLAWRDLPGGVLATVLIISWLALCVLTLGCLLPMELPSWGPLLRRGIKLGVLASAGLSLCAVLTLGTLLAVFSFHNYERVVEYRGQTLVETDEGFMDPEYHYYVYHSPLLRGKVSLYGPKWERLIEPSEK